MESIETQKGLLANRLGIVFDGDFVKGIIESLNITTIDGVEYVKHQGYLIPIEPNYWKLYNDLVETCKQRLPDKFNLRKAYYHDFDSIYTLEDKSPILLKGFVDAILNIFDADYMRIRKSDFSYDLYVLYIDNPSKHVHLNMNFTQRESVEYYDKVVFNQVGQDFPTLAHLVYSAMKDSLNQSGYQTDLNQLKEDFAVMCHVIYEDSDTRYYTHDGMIQIHDCTQEVI